MTQLSLLQTIDLGPSKLLPVPGKVHRRGFIYGSWRIRASAVDPIVSVDVAAPVVVHWAGPPWLVRPYRQDPVHRLAEGGWQPVAHKPRCINICVVIYRL